MLTKQIEPKIGDILVLDVDYYSDDSEQSSEAWYYLILDLDITADRIRIVKIGDNNVNSTCCDEVMFSLILSTIICDLNRLQKDTSINNHWHLL